MRKEKTRLLWIFVLAFQVSVGFSPAVSTADELLSSDVKANSHGTQCPGDFDNNGTVNLTDFLAFAKVFGARSGDVNFDGRMDMDGSGAIDLMDFLSFARVFGTTCEALPAPPCDVTPPPVDPTPVAPVEVACEDWAEFHVGPNGRVHVPFTGDRWYNSNVWNKAAAGDEPYEQCILRRVVDGEDEYGWRWRWPLGNGDVKGYPEVIYGFKPWNLPTRTALPKQISALRELRVDYEAYLDAEGAYNLAFSMWVTRDNPPTPEGITHEIMVWMDRSCGFEPYPDSRVAEVELGGATYTLVIETEQSTFGQTYIAFVSHVDQFKGSVDFAAFLAYLVEKGHVPDDHYVTDIELGNEAVSGRGELWLKKFEVVVR